MLRYRTKLENINHIDSILVANSTYQITNNLKKRLFDEKVLENKCALCNNKA